MNIKNLTEAAGCTKGREINDFGVTDNIGDAGLPTLKVKTLLKMWFQDEVDISTKTLPSLEKAVIDDITGETSNILSSNEMALGKKIARLAYVATKAFTVSESKSSLSRGCGTMIISPEISSEPFPWMVEKCGDLEGETLDTASIDVVIDGARFTEDGTKILSAYIFKAGATYYSSRTNATHSIDEELIPLTMLEAVKSLVPEGEERLVELTYVYAGSAADRSKRGEKWWYNGSATENTLSDSFLNTEEGRKIISPVDEKFIKVFNQHAEGHLCNESDCEKCPKAFECRFKPYVEALDEVERQSKDCVYSDDQQKAIDWNKGVARLLAAAGSGKTEIIAEHVVQTVLNMVSEGWDAVDAVRTFMCITFTHNGAEEMKARIIAKLKKHDIFVAPTDLQISTFHTWALEFIKPYWKELGYNKPFGADEDSAVINDIDHSVMIANILEENPVNGLRVDVSDNAKNGVIAAAKIVFNAIKKQNLTDEEFDDNLSLADVLNDDAVASMLRVGDMTDTSVDELIDLYKEYRARLRDLSLLEFDDMIIYATKVIESHPEALEELGYHHIIVDEAQDTSIIQITGIVKPAINTKCFEEALIVGDDAQNIYGEMLNTSVECFIHLDRYLECPVTELTMLDNYRSKQEIIDAAEKIIALNQNQIHKSVHCVRGNGGYVSVKQVYSKEDEYQFAIDLIKKNVEAGTYSYNDHAIEMPTNAQCDAYAAALQQAGIPVIRMNPQKYVENSFVEAALQLGSAFWEPSSTRKYRNYLVAKCNGQLSEMMTEKEIEEEIDSLRKIFEQIEQFDFEYQRHIFHSLLDELAGHDEIFDGFYAMLKNHEDLPSELEFLMNFKHFGREQTKRMVKLYDGVVLITCHSSKGLEWPVVITTLTGFDSTKLHWNGKNDRNNKMLEEKRRLLYVSMTRARDELYIVGNPIAASYRTQDGVLNEVPNQFLKMVCDALGEKFSMVDPDAAAKEALKAEARKKQAAFRKERQAAERARLQEHLAKIALARAAR